MRFPRDWPQQQFQSRMSALSACHQLLSLPTCECGQDHRPEMAEVLVASMLLQAAVLSLLAILPDEIEVPTHVTP